jgi:release factor glutamine methyltransferase
MPALQDQFISELRGMYSQTEARQLYRIFMEEKFGVKNESLLAGNLKPQAAIHLQNFAAELKTGKPYQYILGKAWFHKHRLKVNEHVLIPRPETEELVEWIIELYKHVPHLSLLDVGTGSGAIAITLATELQASVYALDISDSALQVARENARACSADVYFFQHDIREPLPADLKFDLIVSNPPYVPLFEKETLPRQVAGFEPALALFVDDDDPLLFYKAIQKNAMPALKRGGCFFFELHQHYGGQVQQLFQTKEFSKTELKTDLSGRKRMLRAGLNM